MRPETRSRLIESGLDRFVDLLIEDTLATPVRRLVDLHDFAGLLASALRSAAADPTVERLVRERVRELKGLGGSGPLPVPAELRAPLRELVRRPFVPDRDLLGEILDHRASRVILKGLLEDAVVSFATRFKTPMPVPAPLKGLGVLGGRLGGVAATVSQEVERTVEAKAREFVGAAVDRLVGKLADQLCDPDESAVYASWRAHALDTLLQADRRKLLGEVDKLDPEALAGSALELVRVFVDREGFPGELERTLESVVAESGEKTVRDVLGGVEHHAIGLLRELLRARARAVVETEAFATWWDDMSGDRSEKA